jgi:hypothetical protein
MALSMVKPTGLYPGPEGRALIRIKQSCIRLAVVLEGGFMSIRKFAAAPIMAGLILAGLASPLAAQTVPDDVRCFVIANYFAKNNSDAKGREVAAQSVFFFSGRIEARADAATVTSAIRRLMATIDAKSATTEMSACAGRMQQGLVMIQNAARAAGPPPPKK